MLTPLRALAIKEEGHGVYTNVQPCDGMLHSLQVR